MIGLISLIFSCITLILCLVYLVFYFSIYKTYNSILDQDEFTGIDDQIKEMYKIFIDENKDAITLNINNEKAYFLQRFIGNPYDINQCYAQYILSLVDDNIETKDIQPLVDKIEEVTNISSTPV